MNKNAIKKFAIEARKKLIASVSDRAGMLGITPEGCSEPVSKGVDFEVYKTIAGTEITLGKSQCEQRRKLKERVEARGFEAVVEEVAYTWFNRICAIRFMEVNDYLPTRVRVLSSEKEGKNEPDIVTQAPDVDLDFTDKEREYVFDCKMNNKLDELFKMLFIKQCNKLSEILPELFEATEDYTEMLLNISYTNKDDIIHMLVNQETGIPEEDFNVSTIGEDGQPTGQVEIIGWLYQYYNTELKDETFAKAKKEKIDKEHIPAATQLFTPDWIVRYMVENSVGRLWIEHLRAIDPAVNEKEVAERFGWKYYLPEAEQEADVNVKLAEIRTSYKDLKPEDITCIDPCMGSGHILVAMFDVLMDIYKSAGYSERDAAFEIVENNIHGLDIDKRAYQLAYFAVMMKGRSYNRRFFSVNEKCKLNIHVVHESNNINKVHLKRFGATMNDEKVRLSNQLSELLMNLEDAREYGSVLNIKNYDWNGLRKFVSSIEEIHQVSFEVLGIEDTRDSILRIIDMAEILANKYDVVITNPPYMGISNANLKLSTYVKDNYPDSKTDLYSVFIEKCRLLTKEYGYQAMITQHSWMFLSSFEKLRHNMKKQTILNMVHLGARAFEEIAGEVVQTTSFVLANCSIKDYKAVYCRLVNGGGPREKESVFLSGAFQFITSQSCYEKIQGSPIAYWASDALISDFEKGQILKKNGDTRQGMATSDNNRFLRLWHEVDFTKIGLNMSNAENAKESKMKWFPYNKGGSYRKWYGNIDYVINYENDGYEVKEYATSLYKTPTRTIKSISEYFKKCLSWSKISTGNIAFRFYPNGFIFDVAGCCIFYNDENRMLYDFGFINSKVAMSILSILAPTMNFEAGHVAMLPIIYEERECNRVKALVQENIRIATDEWNDYEQSWEFKTHPLVRERKLCGNEDVLISELFENWKKHAQDRIDILRRNEEELNSIFISIYGLNEEIDPKIESEEVTLRQAVLEEDIKSLVSYAVGCMFGRYSHEIDGLLFAGGQFDVNKYNEQILVKDNAILISDEEYCEGDIVERFANWIKIVFGDTTFCENLEYVASVIGGSGSSAKEKLRTYFINDFYKEHCSHYSVTGSGKRPIYWMFDSGKENGFKCLMYIHRYDQDTIGKLRTDYLHTIQKSIVNAKNRCEYTLGNATSSTEKAYATKKLEKYSKQLAEISIYDEAIGHMANMRLKLCLDDGVKANYQKLQDVDVANEGKKTIKVNLLAKI